MRRLLIALILFIPILAVGAEEPNYADKPYDARPAYGLFGNLNMNLHSADFTELPPHPCCSPRFESGSGIGYNFGLFFSFPVSESWEIFLRAGYYDLSGLLSKDESIGAVLDPNTNTSVPGEIEHSVDGSITSVALAPLLSYRVSDQLRLHFGFRGGYVLTKDFEQKEELKEPSFGVFQDTRTRTRFEVSAEIPDASAIEAAAMAGISYDIPLNSAYTFFLVPEAYFTYGLTNVSSELDWTVNTFHGGIALKYAPRQIIPPKPPPPPPPPPPLPPPPPPPAAPVLDATILAVGVEDDGNENDVSTLRVEEFLYRRMHPILNYVFFDYNSAELPERYIRMGDEERKNFSVKNLYDLKTMEVYRHVLNITGRRMEFYPQARVTLVGCNSNEGAEKGNTELSRKRAEAVKEYLVNVWEIPEDRITIESRNLPSLPSNPKDPDGIQENRRVEIIANIPQVFEPMIIRDTLRTANPPHIRFKTKINTDIGIDSWKIITAQNNRDLRVFAGENDPPATLDWDLEKEDEQDFVPRFDEPLNYKLEVVDNDNKVWQSPVQTLPVDQVTIERKMFEMVEDKEIDRFSLIMFGFNQATLSEENKRIAEFAQDRIRKNSTVTIVGYSDRVGEEDHNLKLSRRRAFATADALGIDRRYAKGVGEMDLLYDNDTPEGRFYSRTVTIEIVTEIK